MRIIDIGDIRYQVLQEISGNNEKLISMLKNKCSDDSDFFLLKKSGSVGFSTGVPPFLLCRRIEEAVYTELKEPKKKRHKKKQGWK